MNYMDTKVKNFIRYYYHINDVLPICPFLVAPLEGFQDTIIFGPLSLTKNHDNFINQLYAKTPRHEINDYNLRLFLYDKQLILAIIIPLSIRDEAERKGLVLCLGILADIHLFAQSPNPLVVYFKSFIDLININFGFSLPEKDSEKLVEIIRNPSQYQHTVKKLVRTMITISQIIDQLKPCGLKKSWSYKIFKDTRNIFTPKVIVCPENITFYEILEIIIQETIELISKKGVLAVENALEDKFIDKDIIVIYKLPKPLLQGKRIRIKKLRKNKYICIS